MIPLRDNIPSSKVPIVNYFFIAINIIVFMYQSSIPSTSLLKEFINQYGFVPARFVSDFSSAWQTLFTSLFLHGGLFHILGNMLFLYIFGDNVEDHLGHIRYFFYYILFGLTGTFSQFILNPQSSIPQIGASGCISGILGCYFIFYPSARVLTLIPLGFFSRVVVLPAVFFLGFWFVIQLFSGGTSILIKTFIGDVGGVAYLAHIGGFIAGLLIGVRYKNKGRKKIKTSWRYI